MRAIRVPEKSASADALKFSLEDVERPSPNDGECLIEVHASGVNPSDVKGLLGKMPRLVWPRTPGRDFAGIVVEGPQAHIGKEIWGTGGDVGMGRDGAHAAYMIVSADAVREKPPNLSMHEAGSLGVSWTCAWLGMVHRARVAAGETVAVLGANGKVGEATIQIATAAGATVIGVERSTGRYRGHATGPVDIVDLSREPDARQAILDRTDGRGADIIMNTVGDPYFEVAANSLAKNGRQIIISAIVEECTINLRTFYRGNHVMIGVSNMDHDHVVSAALMEEMKPGFEAGTYRPYPIRNENVFGFARVGDAYRAVLEETTRERIVIDPRK